MDKTYAYPPITPKGSTPTATQQAGFNAASFAGGIVDSVVDNLTGSDLLGDIAGGLTARFVQQQQSR